MIRALIVEDEIHCQELLTRKISRLFPEIQLLACVSSVEEARKVLNKNVVDLVFLDNKLKGGLGLELINNDTAKNYEVIITTAFTEYAIDALNADVCYYLLKPFTEDELKIAIEKVLQKINIRTQTVLVGISDLKLVKFDQILYLRSNGAYTAFYLTDKTTIIASRNLGYYEKRLPDTLFFRIHHSIIINTQAIEKIERVPALSIKLKEVDTLLPISNRKAPQFVKLLQQL